MEENALNLFDHIIAEKVDANKQNSTTNSTNKNATSNTDNNWLDENDQSQSISTNHDGDDESSLSIIIPSVPQPTLPKIISFTNTTRKGGTTSKIFIKYVEQHKNSKTLKQ